MIAIAMKSFTIEEGVAISDNIERRIRANIAGMRTAHMQIRHGVYFKNLPKPHLFMEPWGDTAEGRAMRKWIGENISGKYSIQSSYVLFENHDDALLCYLRYGG